MSEDIIIIILVVMIQGLKMCFCLMRMGECDLSGKSTEPTISRADRPNRKIHIKIANPRRFEGINLTLCIITFISLRVLWKK